MTRSCGGLTSGIVHDQLWGEKSAKEACKLAGILTREVNNVNLSPRSPYLKASFVIDRITRCKDKIIPPCPTQEMRFRTGYSSD